MFKHFIDSFKAKFFFIVAYFLVTIQYYYWAVITYFNEARFRQIYILIGSAIVLSLLLLTDPDIGIIKHLSVGATTIAELLILSKVVLYASMLHITRKGLLDYVDMEELYNESKKSPEGAGRAMMGVGLISIAISITIYSATHI